MTKEKNNNILDLSVIIPFKNEEVRLLDTINNNINQLSTSKFKWEIIGVDNESTDKSAAIFKEIQNDDIKYVLHKNGGSATARNCGAEISRGKYLFFMDGHVLTSSNFFKECIDFFEKSDAGIVHGVTKWTGSSALGYHLDPHFDLFAGVWVKNTHGLEKPYKCAMAGHGCFVVKRDVFEKINGYNRYYKGNGAEEAYLDIKSWMFGEPVYMLPHIYHEHLPERGYTKYGGHYNAVLGAYSLGGIKLAEIVKNNLKVEDSIFYEAIRLGDEDRNFIEKNASFSFDEIVNYFKENEVP